MTLDADRAVYDLSPAARIIVLVGVVLASTCYTATILVATTLLPQMQGLDITPLIVLLIIFFLRQVIARYGYGLVPF